LGKFIANNTTSVTPEYFHSIWSMPILQDSNLLHI